MNQNLVKTAEIALIRSIGEQLSDQSKKGRLRNKSNSLVSECDKMLRESQGITESEIKQIERLLTDFFEITGWAGNNKDAMTVISFCLSLAENSKFEYPDKIIKAMNDIFDYRERAGKVKNPCLWAGGVASEKWEQLVN